MIRGIILEGLSCSGKTSLLKSLKKVQAECLDTERSLIVLGEHYSQVLQKIQNEYIKYDRDQHLEILKERVEMLESISRFANSLGNASRESRGLFYILERFHLNHREAFPNQDCEAIKSIEQRLLSLNAQCYLLFISDSKVRDRLISRNPNVDQNSINEYIVARDQLNLASKNSLVETIMINTDNKNWDEIARNILNDFERN